MPTYGLVEDTSRLAINNESQYDNTELANTLARLRAEARQTMANTSRGLRDITGEFSEASSQLVAGQLVKDEYFTLFEAVGALEIMDPKMDSGYVPPNDTFESEFDPCSPLKPSEVIWIIDQLLCLEITWLDGYPLSQTIYTSLHIDRLLSPKKVHKDTFHIGDQIPPPRNEDDALVHNILRAYCIALVKCCQLALHLIQSQNFYEEEDFVTHLFGRELLPEIGSKTAEDLLVESINSFSEHERSLPDDITRALMARFRFRLTLMQNLADDARGWEGLRSYLRLIQESHILSKPVPTAFSEKVQRQLATSTPPRPMIQISFDLACSKWAALCEEMIAAYRLTSSRIIQSPHSLQRATWVFAYLGQPGTLARAQMQTLLFADQAVAGEVNHFDLLLNDISDLALAGDSLVDPLNFNVEVTSDPRHICSTILRGFMEKAIEEYLNLYRMVCQNRCRTRRTFTQAIPILYALEQEADSVDRDLKKHSASLRTKVKHPKTGRLEELNPLQSWCYFHTLRILAWTVQFGFETDIYLPDELAGMYRFLSILCVYRSSLISHLIRFVSERRKTLRDSKRGSECAASHDFLVSLNDTAQLTHSLAEALFKLYCLVARVGIIKAPKRDFADPELLYEARMKPYLSIRGDDIPSCKSFEEDIEEQGRTSFNESVESIDEDIKYAKYMLAELKKFTPEQAKYIGTEEEWKREIKQTETTCVAIAVAVSQLKRITEKHGTNDLGRLVDCRLEKKYHEWWIIPQLKERAGK